MREDAAGTRGFKPVRCKAAGKTQQALRETNGPQKPGRAIAPKGCYSPFASAPRDLAFTISGSCHAVPHDVFGRRSDPTSTTQMYDITTVTASAGSSPSLKCSFPKSGPTPPLVHGGGSWSTKSPDGAEWFPVDQLDQGHNVSVNKKRKPLFGDVFSRDEGYVLTPVRLVQRQPIAAFGEIRGPTHPGPVQGGPWSSDITTREVGRSAPTLVHTLVQQEVAQ